MGNGGGDKTDMEAGGLLIISYVSRQRLGHVSRGEKTSLAAGVVMYKRMT